jgi:hypothetical protein
MSHRRFAFSWSSLYPNASQADYAAAEERVTSVSGPLLHMRQSIVPTAAAQNSAHHGPTSILATRKPLSFPCRSFSQEKYL